MNVKKQTKNKNNEKIGTTFWDLVKKPWFLIIILLIIIGLLVFKVPFDIGPIHIGTNSNLKNDTIVIIKKDTILLNNAIEITKPKSLKKKDNSTKISIKKSDTIITVENQPANINLGTNNGIIGNVGELNVNNVKRQRVLGYNNKADLIRYLNRAFGENKSQDSCIIIYALEGDLEALTYAKEILLFLKGKKLNVSNQIVQYRHTSFTEGIFILPKFDSIMEISTEDKKNNCACVVVGTYPL